MPELLSCLVEHISVFPATHANSSNYRVTINVSTVHNSTVDPAALALPICAVMKTFGIGSLFKADRAMWVLEGLPHCTHAP